MFLRMESGLPTLRKQQGLRLSRSHICHLYVELSRRHARRSMLGPQVTRQRPPRSRVDAESRKVKPPAKIRHDTPWPRHQPTASRQLSRNVETEVLKQRQPQKKRRRRRYDDPRSTPLGKMCKGRIIWEADDSTLWVGVGGDPVGEHGTRREEREMGYRLPDVSEADAVV